MYNNRVRNIEIPENLFSNLGESRSVEIRKKEAEPIKKYEEENEIKLTNYSQKNEYRNRMNRIYEDIKDLKPIDSEVDNTLYFNNYIEKGIVVKPKSSSLKQFWTEYRLINNEKKEIQKEQPVKNIDNFDDLFEVLSIRVAEINDYISELKEMRLEINETSNRLEKEQEKLTAEKEEFLNFKKQEEDKIKEQKANLKINFERLQTIIDDLDKKLESIDD